MGTLLTGSQIKDSLLDPDGKSTWLEIFERHHFNKLPTGKQLGIAPFFPGSLGPVCYDLTIGSEVYSLRRGTKTTLTNDDSISIDPGETILILTQEFLALGPNVAAITLARARLMNEGITLSSAKIDPTWFGCLQIPITNNARSTITLTRGDRFCTLLIFKLETPLEPAKYLTKDNTPHLGQTTLRYQPRHAVSWQPRQADTVRDKDMNDVVAAFGPPFDIVRGMMVWNQTKLVEYMEKTWSPTVLRDLKQYVWAEEFQQMKKFRETEVALLNQQIELLKKTRAADLARSAAMLFAIIGWIGTVIALLWKVFQ